MLSFCRRFLASSIRQTPLHPFSFCYSTDPPPRKPTAIALKECDLAESFIKGSGAGGQKINKNRSNVQLLHLPTGLRVETQRFRELHANRKEARKLMKGKLDDLYNEELSKNSVERRKVQKVKENKARKAKKKYGGDRDGPKS